MANETPTGIFNGKFSYWSVHQAQFNGGKVNTKTKNAHKNLDSHIGFASTIKMIRLLHSHTTFNETHIFSIKWKSVCRHQHIEQDFRSICLNYSIVMIIPFIVNRDTNTIFKMMIYFFLGIWELLHGYRFRFTFILRCSHFDYLFWTICNNRVLFILYRCWDLLSNQVRFFFLSSSFEFYANWDLCWSWDSVSCNVYEIPIVFFIRAIGINRWRQPHLARTIARELQLHLQICYDLSIQIDSELF